MTSSAAAGFHPLYRGTWFPTCAGLRCRLPAPTVSIRYIAVLGFQHLIWTSCQYVLRGVSIRYIAVLGFQRPACVFRVHRYHHVSIRYIAVLGFQQNVRVQHRRSFRVSIRYIAVLGFQPVQTGSLILAAKEVSIRYIAVLGFQQDKADNVFEELGKFPSAISRYLVSNAMSGLQRAARGCFHPLYRGTWFPTLPQKRPL